MISLDLNGELPRYGRGECSWLCRVPRPFHVIGSQSLGEQGSFDLLFGQTLKEAARRMGFQQEVNQQEMGSSAININ